MTKKQIIQTDKAPQAIGTYSQAVKIDNTVYLSGQIPLNPKTMTIESENFQDQTKQTFDNLKAVTEAAGGTLNDIAKLNIYLTDLTNFNTVNEIMATYFTEPYPARAALGINQLPKNAQIEMDAILILNN